VITTHGSLYTEILALMMRGNPPPLRLQKLVVLSAAHLGGTDLIRRTWEQHQQESIRWYDFYRSVLLLLLVTRKRAAAEAMLRYAPPRQSILGIFIPGDKEDDKVAPPIMDDGCSRLQEEVQQGAFFHPSDDCQGFLGSTLCTELCVRGAVRSRPIYSDFGALLHEEL
jgi:hypothetical protein